MSDTERPTVRRGLLLRAVMEELAEAKAPMKQAAAIAAVEARLAAEFSQHELQLSGNTGFARWKMYLIWGSTGLRTAGWLTKERAGWQITPQGRAELENDTGGEYLLAESERIYQEQRHEKLASREEASGYSRVLEAAP